MSSAITRIKAIRIANETADYFEGKPLNRIVECVHEMMEAGKMTFDGQEIKISGEKGVNTAKNKDLETLDDIRMMVSLCGGTLESFLDEMNERLTNGSLRMENGRMVLPRVQTGEFEDVCRDKCLDAQSILDKATQAVKRGQL